MNPVSAQADTQPNAGRLPAREFIPSYSYPSDKFPSRHQSFAFSAFLLIALLIGFHPRGHAAELQPPTQPILRVETGMHTAAINRISVDTANRYLVTASEDKTARVWSLPSGKLLRVLRPPVGPENEGKLFAVAISPDGGTVACGGNTGYAWDQSYSIYLFDRESGRMLRRIKVPNQIQNQIMDLSYSPDGKFLAVAFGGSGGSNFFTGIQVYNIPDYALIPPKGEEEKYGDQSLSVNFDRKGKMVATSYDRYIRIYTCIGPDKNPSFELFKENPKPARGKLCSAAISPDGSKVAVGFGDSTQVNVLSGDDLSFLYAPQQATGKSYGSHSSVAWSDDGRFLYAGGRRTDQQGNEPIRRWENGGQGTEKDLLPEAGDKIMDLRPLLGGGVAFGTSDPAFGTFDAEGHRNLFQGASTADYRGNKEELRISTDGKIVRFSYERGGKSPARFTVGRRLLDTSIAKRDSAFRPPITKTKAFTVAGWMNTRQPKLNGNPLTWLPDEMSECLAITPDNKGFLLGSDRALRLFDLKGKISWTVQAPGPDYAVNISTDGKLAVAAFGDGTIHWYRMTDGKELLAFFPHADKKRWVAWTPSGYYDCSPGGEDLIGWHVNNGKDQAADFFPASRFRDQFYRPDIVAKVLDTEDEAEALRLANEETGRIQQNIVTVDKTLPPVIRILSPTEGETVSTKEITVKCVLRTPSGAPVTSVKALFDGRPAPGFRDLQEVPDTPDTNQEATRTLKVTLPEKDTALSLIAENKYAASVPATVQLKWGGAAPPPVDDLTKPKLYVLAVGVSKYQDASLELKYPSKDATDFSEAMEKQKGGLYRDVELKVLTDDAATRDSIVNGLDWIQKQTTSRDVAMVFLSGHGTNDPTGHFYFIPSNYNHDMLRSTGLPRTEIIDTLTAIAGKALFFVDACHSGNAAGTRAKALGTDLTGIINELSSAENGTVVFSASTGSEIAQEDDAWGNGAFTKAVIEGITGKPDSKNEGQTVAAMLDSFKKTGRITVKMMDTYISERVKELTKGTQHPTTQIPPSVPDFPFAVPQ
jgi:WD40 repeat protein